MKAKFYLIPVALLLLASCEKSMSEGQTTQSQYLTGGRLRTEAEVRGIAMSSVLMFSSGQTKSSPKEIASIIPSMGVTKSPMNSPLFYVVNFGDEDGFVVVGADSDSPEVIVYANKGNYNGVDSEIGAFNLYMAEMSEQLSSFVKRGTDVPIADYYKTYTDESSVVNEPLVTVHWGQHQPFNWYCSSPFDDNIPAGCVAVALAQIMSSYSYPTSISLSYPSSTTSSIALVWENMTDVSHLAGAHTNDCSTCSQMAALLREIGHRVGMKYGIRCSTAKDINVRTTLSSFGYKSSEYQNYSLSKIMNSLNSKHPVYISAGAAGEDVGHAWVVDGSLYTCKTKTTYLISKNFRKVVAEEFVKNWYLNFNYGWSGSCDGYFLAATREHGSGEIIVGGSYDEWKVSMFTGAEGYNQNVAIIPDIYH